MNPAFWKVCLLQILLPTLSLSCSGGGRCQYFKKRLDEGFYSRLNQLSKQTIENNSETLLAPTVKFTLSARHLSGVEELGSPSAYPNIWINNNMYKDGVCIVPNNPNPFWRDNFEVAYDEGANTFLKIEVRSETSDFWGYDTFFMGNTIVYVKDMLCKGRSIESPLWRDTGFYIGYIVVTTTDVINGGEKCD